MHRMAEFDLGRAEVSPNRPVTAAGRSVTLASDDIHDAIICRDEYDGRLTLAMPGKSRDEWLTDLSAVNW